ANCNSHFPIYFIAGNRDFTLGQTFAKKSHLTILNEPYTLIIENKKILLMHGDLLCTDDISYLKFRKIIRNPILLFILKKLPLKTRLKLAFSLRNSSSKHMHQKAKNIMDTTNKGVSLYTNKYKCDLLIHGHTHRPKIHKPKINEQILVSRITLGDWGEQAIGLELNEKDFKYELIDYIN
ncbi:MAG: UDP-2,3-diacylglucosamine diphosphatase, partial [Saccharospirillaceae bacterium]|nr:UDP-2,3-diacylglucosamine diphosphatase [Pseudomonadales bacterium]NRB81872.1 UDP-2,3-diacylglucosamine diphosphatase [Saccharospirillaceae bacterium]